MAAEEPIGIIPRIDLVFRTLMNDPVILLDFLNAVIAPRVQIVSVQILNSDVLDLIGERSAIVDVKAMDAEGRVYQIEMQTWNHTGLQKRILFDWAALYRSLIKAGDTKDSRGNNFSSSHRQAEFLSRRGVDMTRSIAESCG